jgi:hypothetical protein
MRDIWQTTNIDYGAKWGLATCPKKLKSNGIKRLLERALWEQGIRQPLTNMNILSPIIDIMAAIEIVSGCIQFNRILFMAATHVLAELNHNYKFSCANSIITTL